MSDPFMTLPEDDYKEAAGKALGRLLRMLDPGDWEIAADALTYYGAMVRNACAFRARKAKTPMDARRAIIGLSVWCKSYTPPPKRHAFGGVVFEETGVTRIPRKGEWFLLKEEAICASDSRRTFSCPILRVVQGEG